MDQRTALRILIESSALQPADREKMLAALPSLSDQDVVELGTALARQKKDDVAAAAKAVDAIDNLLAE
ncbi:hypothetical protein A2348_04015 [Candidatus Uhrbacteria bacterium RIFOXYB12_FULL_58_10]|uniref:Uncharacterized protein n=1 Tax=Candidatus Uhrbacteria bacterium RIFOXYB2_FULL_57_15 TaxID=1802422 RepID=A0A1F7W9I5_9BACT|nr:MAG: hypothetical protein A2348_04015 [Candidatus Uhrbacteria bacterium RIFOXYB12_FULL_58_10]OGL99483.1 MAG: hypothetical protein A2304_04155 [Candidatus Uhrbacteria bacterium RIFOXYB2_FULL_57_15]OGL99882.1 MAG: hypothetical protein A2501_05105 [Candidatus Uhrbacteria bacterium RIFOXYC12_FULL_57_11]